MIQTLKSALSLRFKFHVNKDGTNTFTTKTLKQNEEFLNLDTSSLTSLQYNVVGSYATMINQKIIVNISFDSMFIFKVEEKVQGEWKETHIFQGCGKKHFDYLTKSEEQRILILPMTSVNASVPLKITVMGVD